MTQAFENGFIAGRTWQDSWTPGGPWVYTGKPQVYRYDLEWFYEFSGERRAEWLAGWKAGLQGEGE